MQLSRNSIEFVVPGTPKGKQRPRVTRAGHAYTPKDTVVYENMVKLSCYNAMQDKEPLHGAVKMTIQAFFEVPKSYSKRRREKMLKGEILHTTKPDADNLMKSIADGCNGVAYDDDKQICIMTLTKKYALEPRVEVLIEEMREPE